MPSRQAGRGPCGINLPVGDEVGEAVHQGPGSQGWAMIGLYLGALVLTGLFTLLPGRIMGHVAFG